MQRVSGTETIPIELSLLIKQSVNKKNAWQFGLAKHLRFLHKVHVAPVPESESSGLSLIYRSHKAVLTINLQLDLILTSGQIPVRPFFYTRDWLSPI